MITDVLKIATGVIDKVGDLFPSQMEKEQAKARLLELQRKGELADIEMSVEILLAEAKSQDKFTSRARPAFMYVFYVIILFAVPMGILNAINPNLGMAVSEGMQAWWSALPSELWWTFGVGFTGYVTSRSIDKAGILKRKKQAGF